jgi:hypothetical protein
MKIDFVNKNGYFLLALCSRNQFFAQCYRTASSQNTSGKKKTVSPQQPEDLKADGRSHRTKFPGTSQRDQPPPAADVGNALRTPVIWPTDKSFLVTNTIIPSTPQETALSAHSNHMTPFNTITDRTP